AARALLDFLLQLVDFSTLAADDDAGARRVDVDLQLVRGALGLDLRHACVREPLLERRTQIEILVQQLRVVAVRVPPPSPRLVESEPESKRMNLLAHSYSFAFSVFFDCRLLTGDCRLRPRLGAASDDAIAAIFSGRSATWTVRCVVRFSTRNARPIGAGRT